MIDAINKEADDLINSFIVRGTSFEVAKKASINTLERCIAELELIDMVHLVGLKPRMDNLKATILIIIEK